ncbi:MAG: hypothetical protein Q8O62_05165 [Aequorivita sp.]|nr:hypothetical protein [Aequorivita sp.]
MKNIIKISIVILIGLICSNIYAQTYRIDNSSSATIANLQNIKQFTSQTGATSNTRNLSTSNDVYVQQIGNENNVVSNTRAIYSNISLFQKGNNNEVLLDITAGAIKENVLQTGINNSVIDLNTKGSLMHTVAVFQKGANQNLIMLGSNSISNSMIISMQGKNQTIIVRNIKN